MVILRSRNLVWLEQSLWRLPGGPTLDWSGPKNTSCELSLHTREAFFDSERATTLRFRYRVDLDSRIKRETSKRLQSVLTGRSIIEDIVTVNLANLRTLSIGSRLVQLFELKIEPRWEQTAQQLWKPVVINTTVELLPDIMKLMAEQDTKMLSWSLHHLKGDRVFLSQPMYFSNPDCGYDDICVPDLNVEIYDTSEGFEFGGKGPSTIFYKERVSERNFTVAVRNLGENAYDAKVRVHIPAQFAYIPDKNYACKIESEPTELDGLEEGMDYEIDDDGGDESDADVKAGLDKFPIPVSKQ